MSGPLNEIALHIGNDRVALSGEFDLRGLVRLEAIIAAIEPILAASMPAGNDEVPNQNPTPQG